jgi:hypothetical protein
LESKGAKASSTNISVHKNLTKSVTPTIALSILKIKYLVAEQNGHNKMVIMALNLKKIKILQIRNKLLSRHAFSFLPQGHGSCNF